ncbi:MAG TPA: protein-disulfide reductase DsbD domain-containing protein [Anaerolineales bacterium]|nr:protein-disulfide reductase DsbD domain-containing protein [Anaerolineales bacterium]
MKLHLHLGVLFFGMLFSLSSVSCAPATNKPIPLASFSENYVNVSISLERNTGGESYLSGTFTPPEGYHLYSKDIPMNGVDGLGRPTLLELTPESQMKVVGDLQESVEPEEPDFEPKELLVYPAGAVTLSLPVELPPGKGWTQAEVKITYMVCSANQCKPPVEGKLVSVRIPGAEMLEH